MLSFISHVFDDDFVTYYRHYLSTQPVDVIRELVIHLMHLITDLSQLPPQYLVSGTQTFCLVKEALLDFLFCGSFFRPSGKFLI